MIKRTHNPRSRAEGRYPAQSGIALVMVLFLTILMTILSIGMVVSVSSDMLINGYYGNTRAAYYAADSGLNIARQYLVNQLKGQVNMHACLGWGANATDINCQPAPLNQNTVATAGMNSLKLSYAGFTSGKLNGGTASNSWPSSFIVADTGNCTNQISPALGSPTTHTTSFGGGAPLITTYVFTFNYQLCSVGTGVTTGGGTTAQQRSAVRELGQLSLTVTAQDTQPTHFSGYGAFINYYAPCSAPLIPGIFSGPTFTNGAWNIGNNGQFIFTDPVGQANPKIDYWTGGGCNQSTSSSYPGVNVQFQQGLQLGQPAVALPQNAYNQAWAAIDGKGCGENGAPACGGTGGGAPSNAQLNQMMKDVNGNFYPSGGTVSGVFMNWGNVAGTDTLGANAVPPAGTGPAGGIYIQGNASIKLTPDSDGVSQDYIITQGATVTTIIVNPSTNQTTFKSGGTTKLLAGVPQTTLTPGATNATVVYVNGKITGLTGPGEGQPAIQNTAMITIAAANDIDITGDLRYTAEPVTANTADTLLYPTYTATATNTLGVFTSHGNIQLSSPYSDQNLWVDGSLAAIGALTTDNPPGQCTTTSCGFTVSGHINTFTNIGGQIQTNIFGASMNTENTYYDRRFTDWNNGGFFPPAFPGITSTTNVPIPPNVAAGQTRTSWAWYTPS